MERGEYVGPCGGVALAGPAARAADHLAGHPARRRRLLGRSDSETSKKSSTRLPRVVAVLSGRTLEPILVEPKGGPITLFRRGPKGEYLVRLNTGDRHWAQHAYQFAHEFTHILANYDEHERRNKWFEESICEMASLFVLRRMSETVEGPAAVSQLEGLQSCAGRVCR